MRRYYLRIESPNLVDIDSSFSFQEFKGAVGFLNENVLCRVLQCRSPSNPCNGAIIVAPRKTSFDDGICRRIFIFNDFAHENCKLTETRLCCCGFQSSFHREKVEEIPSLTVWHDGTVDEDDSRKRLDFEGRVEFVHESRGGDFIVNVEVESREKTYDFVADSGSNGTVPVGD